MKKRIFRSIYLTAMSTLVIGVVLIMAVVYNYFDKQLLENTWEKTEYLMTGVESQGTAYLEQVETDNRITYIAADGTVLYDNQANAAEMENHNEREEIVEAMANGRGTSVRYSNTLSQKTVYCAKKLSDGTILRVSFLQHTVWYLFGITALHIGVCFAVFLVFTWLLASGQAKRMVKPINDLNLENPEIDENYEELGPLVHRIRQQNKKIGEHMRALRTQQEEFEAIANYMQEGLLVMNRKGEILSYNRCVREFFEVGEDLTGKSALLLNRSEQFRNTVTGVLDGRHVTQLIALSKRQYELIANPVVDGTESGIRGAILLIVDVTEREQREQMRREFTSNVSHELKTPLTSIYGMSDLMMNGLVKPEDIAGFAADIHKETARMIRLVTDILKLSMLSESDQPMECKPVDLFFVAKEVISQLEHIAKDKEITLHLTGEHCTIDGDENILFELVYNLCDNAIRYNRVGGSVQISLKGDLQGTVLSVSDTGIGIPKEHQSRIFERFYRVDKSHSSKVGGTGLGLSIVKHAVARHHGEITLTSEENKGTTISILFKNSGACI